VVVEDNEDKQEEPVVPNQAPIIESAKEKPTEDVEMKEAQEEPALETHPTTHTTITVEVSQTIKRTTTRPTRGKKDNATIASRSARRGKAVDADVNMEETPQIVDENTEIETRAEDMAVLHPYETQQAEAQQSAVDDAHIGLTDTNSDMKEGIPPTNELGDQQSTNIDVVENSSKAKAKGQSAKSKKAIATIQSQKVVQDQKEEQVSEIQEVNKIRLFT